MPRSARASLASASPGSRRALRGLATRHGIRPSKALGQHFLVDPNLARAIVADAGVGRGDRVIEIGAGLGSLTVALADAGCEVLALELDRALVPALEEVVGDRPNVRVRREDATQADWAGLLGERPWATVSNLPYNVSVPVLLELLERVPVIERFLVMVQREVADRLLAAPGTEPYGPVSLRVAYHADAELVRRIPAEVFWPRPSVDSALVRMTRRRPTVDVAAEPLFRVVDVAFAERRKTIANALRRLGAPDGLAARAGVDPSLRPERLSLEDFARLTRLLGVA